MENISLVSWGLDWVLDAKAGEHNPDKSLVGMFPVGYTHLTGTCTKG
jgi:hypothetical protein